jgi:hypothetical protein
LQTSKYFSSSNPQLPYICTSLSSTNNANNNNNRHHHQHHASNSSTPSINSSVIWREACPNSFNHLYASSISSLSSSPYKSRYSMGRTDMRAASEERTIMMTKGKLQQNSSTDNNNPRLVKKISSNYDNNSTSANSPLLARKSTGVKFWQGKVHSNSSSSCRAFNTIHASSSREKSPFLYDRRLNKSFETANELMDENDQKFHHEKGLKNSLFRRSSTPQLHNIHGADEGTSRDSVHSSWCCGNFVLKQWKKMNQQC